MQSQDVSMCVCMYVCVCNYIQLLVPVCTRSLNKQTSLNMFVGSQEVQELFLMADITRE